MKTLNGNQTKSSARNSITSELLEKIESLKKQNLLLQSFTDELVHDLRAPLRTLSGFAFLLDRKVKECEKSDNKAAKYLDFIKESSESLNNLIQGMYNYSVLQRTERERVNLNWTLSQVSRNLEGTLKDNQAEVLYPDDLPTLTANSTQLIQLFQNLIQNSIKHRSKESPKVEISWKEDFEKLHFTIKDNGKGIPPKEAERVFDAFESIEPHTRNATGLGLTICQKIIKNHGGTIRVNQSPEPGTEINFTIRR